MNPQHNNNNNTTAASPFTTFYKWCIRSSPLIDSPETVARRVDSKKDDIRRQEEPEYDIVIIGGGTAGCALAARLSEDPGTHVLVLEAGGSSRNVKNSQIPAAYTQLMHSDMDYNLFTEPQENAGGMKKHWAKAKALGGCSASNAMVFHAGAPSDYDEWALSGQEVRLIGHTTNSSRNENNLTHFRYFLKFEKYVPHPDYPKVDPSLRGVNGPVKVGYFGYLHAIGASWIKTCIKLGIPSNPDVNTPAGTLGVTKIMTYIDSTGKRVTTENAYLTPDVLQRPNLKVAVHSHVTRILFETEGSVKKAVGVEFSKTKDGPRYRVRARREIVLSAGAVHSPHILMLSGVGPKEHLAEHNIPLVHHLPGVGQKLQEHIGFPLRLRVKEGLSLSYLSAPKGFQFLKAYMTVFRWMIFGSGPLTSNMGEVAAFVRTDDTNIFPADAYDIEDVTSGPNAPNLEMICVPGAHDIHPIPPGDMITIGAILLRPKSTGTITLKSADPFDAPAIDPKYLNVPNDIACLVRGTRLAMRTAESEPFASSVVHDDNPLLDHNLHILTDAELEKVISKRIETVYHPTSTCRMARLEDGGVVDPYLRVYGIDNLRIVDASIFPRVPSGHTAAPTIAVAEKAADMIKQSLSKL